MRSNLRQTILWYLKVDLSQETWEELLKLVTMNMIWFSSTIMEPLTTLNGFISEWRILEKM